ncbi:hypothetical protein [Kitasatospora sp. LaBMicrA B282]|uniref:hypothetical protein n=1 Tax=Kitasatospora sp. LaBMicrA B282 TaxID=3420949 RepID=UPI003D0B58F0
MRKIIVGAATAALVLIPLAQSASAATDQAAAPANAAQPQACGYVYKPKNVHYISPESQTISGPGGSVSGYGPGTLTLSQTVGVSNTYSGTFGASVGDISASVGFNVTQNWSATESASYTMTDGRHYVLYADKVSQLYSYEIHKVGRCDGYDFGKVGTGYATKFDHLDYNHYQG